MILDELSLEEGALRALGLLDPASRERFDRALRANPVLASRVAEFRDIAASVALARGGPLVTPPVSVLVGALERAGAVRPPKSRTVFPLVWWLAVAAAAVVAVLVAIPFGKGPGDAGEEPSAVAREASAGSPGDGDVGDAGDGGGFSGEEGDPERRRTLRELLDKLHRLERGNATPGVIQDLARLRNELESLKQADAERFAGGPRVSRTVVVEMVEPGTGPETGTESGDGLSKRVGDYIAAGIEVETEPVREGADGSSGSESAENPPVILEDAGLPDLGGTAIDTNVYYRNFPAGADAFERIDDGRVWDAANARIWVETSEPGLYLAVLPPEGFDPDFPQDFEGLIPRAGTLPPPVVSEAPGVVPPPIPAPAEVESAPLSRLPVPVPPVAFSIYDETTGRGSVIVGNLGHLESDRAYQLWMRDAGSNRYISVGLLPPASAPVERFDFDLLGPGISPSEFMLTIEDADGAADPGAAVVLHGP